MVNIYIRAASKLSRAHLTNLVSGSEQFFAYLYQTCVVYTISNIVLIFVIRVIHANMLIASSFNLLTNTDL